MNEHETQRIETAVLRRDAAFVTLPRPDYDADRGGIRSGAAPTLSAVGGLLLSAAAFGSWLRVTRLANADAEAQVVHEVMGRDLAGGILLAVLGIGAVIATAGWFRRHRRVRQVAHGIVLAGAATAGVLLIGLQSRIADTAAAAIDQAGFFDLNVGAGWGAWAALIAACALALSSAFAALVGPPASSPDHGGT